MFQAGPAHYPELLIFVLRILYVAPRSCACLCTPMRCTEMYYFRHTKFDPSDVIVGRTKLAIFRYGDALLFVSGADVTPN